MKLSGCAPDLAAVSWAPSNRLAGRVDKRAIAPTPADRHQAEYFLQVLTDRCRLIDARIAEQRDQIAIALTRGDVRYADGVRRLMRSDEREWWDLQRMIDRLRLRFPLRARSEVSADLAPAARAVR